MTLPLLEPELEQLLHEVAADPKSKLLRADRPSVLRGPFDQDPMVRESCTGLTSAERELLRVYRHELGAALRSVCFELVYGRNTHETCLFADHGEDDFPERHSQAESMRRAREAGRRLNKAKINSLLARLTRSARPLDYATLSCRVSPSTSSYLALSDAYELEQIPRLERLAVDRASSLVTSRREDAHVHSYRGYTTTCDGRLKDALLQYRHAYVIGGEWPNEALSCLVLAVQCGSPSHFFEAQGFLDNPAITDDAVHRWVEDQVFRWQLGTWKATALARPFARAHTNKTNERSGYVLDTLFAL